MPDEIAVMVGMDGKIVSIYEKGNIVIYQKSGCQCNTYHWHQSRDLVFSLGGVTGIKELRNKMREAIEFMGDCRVLITGSISGVPYFELEKAAFNVWEGFGDPFEYLDDVAEEEAKSRAEKNDGIEMVVPSPVEVFPGCYRISLREIQRDNTLFTSKQVLLPFIQRGNYRILEILCDHVPPWLEGGLATGEYFGSIEACGRNTSKITILSNQENPGVLPFVDLE